MFMQDFDLSWSVSALDYSHKTQNELLVKSVRKRVPLFDQEVFNIDPDDPLDQLDVIDLTDDQDAEAMDLAMQSHWHEFEFGEEEPPIVPVGPPVVAPVVEMRKNALYVQGDPRPIARLSLLVAWSPPSFTMKCLRHVGCSLTADCSDAGLEALKAWATRSHEFGSAEDHRAARPAECRAGRS